MSANTVANPSQAVLAMRQDWRLVDALLGGTRTMRAAGRAYLPKWPNETDDAYTARLGCAVLFPAYQRTVLTLTGKPFSKPLAIGDDVPPRIKEMLPDIDLQGRNIDTFCAGVFATALGYGLAGILVEFPVRGPNMRTAADEQIAGVRPYWVEIKPHQILGWHAARVAGKWSILQLRLLETVEVKDGLYGTKLVEQVRVLEPGKWAVHRSEDGVWAEAESGVTTLPYVPFIPIYGDRTAFMTGKPPLIEVAHLNVAHWQSSSDQQNILHVARVPILTVTGVEDEKWTITVGASAAIKLPAGATMGFVEHSGSAIKAGSDEIKEIEERMRQAGAELLVITTGRYAITATQVVTENALGICVLQQITQSYEDAIDQALQITADWIGLPEGGHVDIYNEYGTATLQEASAQLLFQTNQAGKLSDETLHEEYQRRGILSADVDWQTEQARLDAQGPALGALPDPEGSGGSTADQTPAPAPTPAPTGTALTVAPEITPVTPIPNSEPAPAAEPAPERMIDMEGFAAIMANAISSITFPAPVVNIQAAAPPVFNMPPITVNVPEGPAPVVNVSSPNITVEAPVVNMPAITLPPPPAITVSSPPVNVTVQRSGEVSFTEDADGNITGAKLQ